MFYFIQVDVSSAIAYLTASKDEAELQIMRKASQVTVDVFNKYLKDQIMEIIDSDKVNLIL
jgi:Xaa-Pro aminopeptidase